jgi:hypothetical protein
VSVYDVFEAFGRERTFSVVEVGGDVDEVEDELF